LRAPFFEYFVKPESVAEALTVKATIYFYNCLFDRAASSIQEFQRLGPQVAEGLAKALTGNPANDQFLRAGGEDSCR